MLVLLYMLDGSEVVVTAAGTIAAGTAFSGMLLTRYFSNCCNCASNCITRCGR